jgi:hypothetical protein
MYFLSFLDDFNPRESIAKDVEIFEEFPFTFWMLRP